MRATGLAAALRVRQPSTCFQSASKMRPRRVGVGWPTDRIPGSDQGSPGGARGRNTGAPSPRRPPLRDRSGRRAVWSRGIGRRRSTANVKPDD
eukprot:5587766-Alexandrium_andersonii.AAC.1